MSVTPQILMLRKGVRADAPLIYSLIEGNRAEGHLLPRSLDELELHAERFTLATLQQRVIGCAELAPLSPRVAEIRSLAVDVSARGYGVGRKLVEAIRQRAVHARYGRVCAFTATAAYFVRLGFRVVPHTQIPEKIRTDCLGCRLYGACGQLAVMLRVDAETARP